MSDFSDEFIAGQIACREGRECPVEASEAFERGFSAQFWSEQNKTEFSIRRDREYQR